jgi:hypothetical protein
MRSFAREMASSASCNGGAVLAVEVHGEGDDDDEDDGENPGDGVEPVKNAGEAAFEGCAAWGAGMVRGVERRCAEELKRGKESDASRWCDSVCGDGVHV